MVFNPRSENVPIIVGADFFLTVIGNTLSKESDDIVWFYPKNCRPYDLVVKGFQIAGLFEHDARCTFDLLDCPCPIFTALAGCCCADELPLLGSYYDFMNRLWNGSRENYSRTCLLSTNKNGRKPVKVIGTDGKLVEPEPDVYATKDMAEHIFKGESLSDGKQDILQAVFSLAAVIPSINNGLIPSKDLTVSGDGTAVKVHAGPFGRNPEYFKSLPENTCTDNLRHYSDPDASWDGTAMKNTGILGVPSICLSAVIMSSRWKSPCC